MSNEINNKDWLDAFREKALSEGASPAPASWEAVGRRVRRAAAIRRGGITAAALLPVVALLLWAPWHRPAQPVPAGPAVAQVAPAPDTTAASVLPEAAPAVPVVPVVPKAAVSKPAGSSVHAPEAAPAVPEDRPVIIEEKESDDSSRPIVAPAQPVDDKKPAQAPPVVTPPEEPYDPFLLAEAETPRHRPRLSVGVRAGSGMVRRHADVPASLSPMALAATYLNSLDPLMDKYLKDFNCNENTYAYFPIAHDYYNNSSISHYRHDLPLTLGLSLRLSLTPRIGLESGVDYTYLHSVEDLGNESLDQRLHFIGIPLRADVRIWSRNGFDLYSGLGVKLEKCVAATLGRISCDEPHLQFAAGAFAGLQYRLGARSWLYFQPELSYYFTRTELITCRTENPVSVSLQAGLRFEL